MKKPLYLFLLGSLLTLASCGGTPATSSGPTSSELTSSEPTSSGPTSSELTSSEPTSSELTSSGSGSSASSTSSSEAVTPSISIEGDTQRTIELEETLVLNAIVEGINAIPTWSVANPDVLALDSMSGSSVTLRALSVGVTTVTAAVGDYSTSVSVEVTHTNWTKSEFEVIDSILLGYEIPYWVEGLDYTLSADSENNILRITVPNFNFDDLRELFVVPHMNAGFSDPGTGYPIVSSKTEEDYSVIQMSRRLFDEENSLIEEGIGTLNVSYIMYATTYKEWNGDVLSGLVERHLGFDLTLPVPSTSASLGYQYGHRGYSVDFGNEVSIRFYGHDGSYIDDLIAAGFSDKGKTTDDINNNEVTFYIDKDELLGAYLRDSGYLGDLSYYEVILVSNPYLSVFPAARVKSFLSHYLEEVPEFPTFNDENVTNYSYSAYATMMVATVTLGGGDFTDAYESLLKEMNYHLVYFDTSRGYDYYVDENNLLEITLRYSEAFKETTFMFQVYTGEQANSVDVETINSTLATYFEGTTAQVPSPTFEVDYVNHYYSSYERAIRVSIIDLDDNGNMVNHVSEYQQDFLDAGWNYDVVQDVYYSSDKMVATYIYDSDGVLVLEIGRYNPSYDAYPEEEVATALENLGITKVLPIPSSSNALTYGLVADGTRMSLEFGPLASQEELTTYIDAVINKGFKRETNTLIGYDVYLADDNSCYLTIDMNERNVVTVEVHYARALDAGASYDSVRSGLSWDYLAVLPQLSFPSTCLGIDEYTYTGSTNEQTYTFYTFNLTDSETIQVLNVFRSSINDEENWSENTSRLNGNIVLAYDYSYSTTYYTYTVKLDIYLTSGGFALNAVGHTAINN